MSNMFEDLQTLLCTPQPDYTGFRVMLEHQQTSLIGREALCSSMVLRLILGFEDLAEKQAKPADILILLRQVIRAYSCRLKIHPSLWQELQPYASNFGIYLSVEQEYYEIMATPWKPSWLENAGSIDNLELRRRDTPAIGDGLIAALSGGIFTSYQSEAQKIAVHECLLAPPGATLLVTLPTGAGKSLCIQLPAWHESQGGRIKGGTTLVIVPTVSLALDQESRARNLFTQAYGQEFAPASLTSATSPGTRTAIYRGIEQGTLPILFTSPESLMTTSLYHVCLEAARQGNIHRLVIDEAHLIETWGAGFRTEFQFLAAYQKKLLDVSQNQLRTILLSATITTSCEKLLRRLFGTKNAFYSLRADRLRPEIAYWFDRVPTRDRREHHVLEALHHLPRPAIVYVMSPDDTEHWLKLLKGQGFQRVATFSGETPTNDRLRIIRDWNENRYDLMIATSAFGVGVDKNDIRTVIHACLPENINRFYQEVGRAGRDGYSAISLMCFTDHDYHQAKSMNRAARITTAKAISRWEGMYQNRRVVVDYNDYMLVDTNATPSDNQEMHKGPSNHEWNEHTLLLMQRAGLVDITDARDDLTQEEQEEDTQEESLSDDRSLWLQIRLREPYITSYPRNSDFSQRFEMERSKEVDTIQQALQMMLNVVSYQLQNCLSREFSRVYTQSQYSCGGCPFCRQVQHPPYTGSMELERDEVANPPPTQIEIPYIRELMGYRQHINVLLSESWSQIDATALRSVLAKLVRMGFQQLVIPDEIIRDDTWTQALILELATNTEKPHLILPSSWLVRTNDHPIYAIPTVTIYPFDQDSADTFHKVLRKRERDILRQVPVLAMARRNLFLPSEHGTFATRINGISYTLERLQAKLYDPDVLIF